MKKKTKGRIVIILFLLFLLIGIVSFIGILFEIILPEIFQPQFTVTKEECRNETQTRGTEEYNFISGWTLDYNNIYGDDFNCNSLYKGISMENYIDRRKIHDCRYYLINTSCYNHTSKEIINLYDNSTYEYSDKEEKICEYQYLIKSEREIIEEVEICEKKEVEEVRVLCVRKCGEEELFESVEDCSIKEGCKTIWFSKSKKTLTTEWLDENCKCKIEEKTNGKFECIKYSCNDYTIEVKK